MDYSNPDYDALLTRNEHRTAPEIETRRLAELSQLVDDWKGGLPVGNVLHHLGCIMDFSSDQPLRGSDKYLSTYVKPDYLSKPPAPAAQADIERFSAHIPESDMTSFAIARSIVDTICNPFDKASDQHPAKRFMTMLDREEKKQKRLAEPEITGSLNPEPEKTLTKRLAPFVKKMRAETGDAQEKLIGVMNVDAAGAVMIKPFAYNPNYLPVKTSERKKAKAFDPYQRGEEEHMEGATVARVTTYAISFEPTQPEQISALKDEVQRAVTMIGAIPPAYALPSGVGIRQYHRPYSPELNTDEFESYDHKTKPYNNSVYVHDGKVVVAQRLDLDDTYNLYYLLEHRIKPGIKTAQALNAARFAEARSAPMSQDDRGRYSVQGNYDPSLQVGDLSSAGADPFIGAIKAAQQLHATGMSDDATTVQQAITLASLALSGRINDKHGAFPSQEIALSSGARQLAYPAALREYATDIMQLIAGAESPEHIAPNLLRRAPSLSEETRNKWRAKMTEQWDSTNVASTEQIMSDANRLMGRLDELTELHDAVATTAKRNPERTALALAGPKNTLVLREQDVEPCIDRLYPGTPYTSRMQGSPSSRKEIPSKLKAFLDPASDVGNPASALLLEFQGGQKR